jgi:hypothetical protein
MSVKSPYKREHYDAVLQAVQGRFDIKSGDLSPSIWIAWRVAIKRMFDEGILIREIIQAIPEAGERRHWPGGTAFWHRVKDVVLKNRRESTTIRITGMQSSSEILRDRIN